MTRTGWVTSGDETECPAITHRDDELPSTSTDPTAVLFRFDNVANFNWEGKGDKAVAVGLLTCRTGARQAGLRGLRQRT
jgi:hypothetical protein